jgi:hypothetical protein
MNAFPRVTTGGGHLSLNSNGINIGWMELTMKTMERVYLFTLEAEWFGWRCSEEAGKVIC